MNITIDSSGLERAQKLLSQIPKGAEKAEMRALNRAIGAARTIAARNIKSHYEVKNIAIKERLKIKRATIGNLSANLTSSGSPIKLWRFNVRFKKGGTVFVTVKRGSGGPRPHSFFATMDNGHMNIFHRVAKPRLPIQGEYGPSVPQMMGNKDVIRNIQERTVEVYNKRLEHEIYNILGGN